MPTIMDIIFRTERMIGSRIGMATNRRTKRLNKTQSIPTINPPKQKDRFMRDFSLMIP